MINKKAGLWPAFFFCSPGNLAWSIARLVSPKFVLERHVPLVAFLILVFVWVAATTANRPASAISASAIPATPRAAGTADAVAPASLVAAAARPAFKLFNRAPLGGTA